MKIEEFEKLLTEFYEGNTTESQEETLREYFETQKIPGHLEKDKKLFLYFHQETTVKVPADLEEKLNQIIDKKEQEELQFSPKNKFRHNWTWIGKIAASLILLIAIGYNIYDFRSTVKEPKDTFTDPRAAYEILQATLIEVSIGLNEGVDEVVESQKDIKRVNSEIRKDLQLQ